MADAQAIAMAAQLRKDLDALRAEGASLREELRARMLDLASCGVEARAIQEGHLERLRLRYGRQVSPRPVGE